MLQFLQENWQYLAPLMGWVAVRVIPTKRNYDIFEIVMRFIGDYLVPNKRVDSLGNKVDKK